MQPTWFRGLEHGHFWRTVNPPTIPPKCQMQFGELRNTAMNWHNPYLQEALDLQRRQRICLTSHSGLVNGRVAKTSFENFSSSSTSSVAGWEPGLFIGVRCQCTVHSPLPNGEERNVLLTLNQVWKGPFEELDVCTLGTGEDNDLVSDTHLRNLKQAVKT